MNMNSVKDAKWVCYERHSSHCILKCFPSYEHEWNSDDRKKLDGLRLLDHVSLQDAQHSETKSTFNVRKSLAWDSAFFTSPGTLL